MTPTNQPPILDAMDRIILPGDRIMYSAVDGRSGVLRRGEVIEAFWKDTPNGPEPRIIVLAERYSQWRKSWEPLETKVTLRYPKRIAVVGRGLTGPEQDGTLDEQQS